MVRYQVSEMSGDFLDETTTPSQAAEPDQTTNVLVDQIQMIHSQPT